MTLTSLSRRRTPLERHHDEVINHLLDSTPTAEIASLYGVSKQAVFIFKVRHEAELDEMRLKVAEQSKALAIAEKVYRIAEYGHIYDLMNEEVAQHGIIETNSEGNRFFRAQLVKEMRGTLRSVAEETGQLPRPEVNIDARQLTTFTIHFDSPAIAEHNVSRETIGNITPPLTLESTEEVPNEPTS